MQKFIDRLTMFLGLGLLLGLKFEWLSKNINNMTLGIHAQEWQINEETSEGNYMYGSHSLFIGCLFFRIELEFAK